MKIKKCFCGSTYVLLHRDSVIFARQNYEGRYPANIAKQNHGFKIRCDNCGMQTCWWHLKSEVYKAWNNPKRG